MPGTNALAYFLMPLVTEKNVLKLWPQIRRIFWPGLPLEPGLTF